MVAQQRGFFPTGNQGIKGAFPDGQTAFRRIDHRHYTLFPTLIARSHSLS